MAKQKFKITNWKTYNDALRQRGKLTLWISDDAVAAWYDKAESERRSRAVYWALELYQERNQAVARQRLTGNNKEWKEKAGYHLRSLAETAMSRMKMIFTERLSLRD